MEDPKPPNGHQNTAAGLYADGMAAYQKGQYADAEQLFAWAAMDQPGHADAWHMRGVCALVTGRLEQAETFIGKALQIKQAAAFYTNLGIVLASAKKIDQAIAAYRASLAINPGDAKACVNLGSMLSRRGEQQEAETLYRRAIKVEPHYVRALINLGGLLVLRKNPAEAESFLRKALAQEPASQEAARALGTLLEKAGRNAEAAPVYQAAGLWGRLEANLRQRVAWDQLAQTDAAWINDLERDQGEAVPSGGALLMYLPDSTPALQRKAALDLANATFGAALQRPPLVQRCLDSVERNGPLRIGYLSADFRDHAVMYVLAGVLEAHDPARAEVHLLSLRALPERYAQRIAAMPAAWHDLSAATDEQAAAKIAEIAPHLLIDLMGYTAGARTNITARRPAPVIVSWLGYPGTLGHERLADYIIGDPVVTPPGHAGDFSETLALMPHCYQPNDRSRPLGPAPVRSEVQLPETGFVFCCFNQFLKINPGTFDIWCRLLSAVPGSVLWLVDERPEGVANLRREAEKRGVPGERLVFAKRKLPAEHLARLQLADLALDTFPYNSHATASDALWAGVPLVTRMGETFASRVAASLLTTHGFPELIAHDDEAYFELALSLANQPEKLRQIRQKLDAARLSSPLFDTMRFARDLERLYEAIWRQHDTPRDQRTPIVLPSA